MHLENNEAEIKHMRRCTRCLLPETFPFIEYDATGVCNYCKRYVYTIPHGAQQLDHLAIREEGREYDCIVMFSGGRDSSYLLHYVTTFLGLRPLAFTYDWGVNTPIAGRNMQKLCDALGVRLVTVRANTDKKLRNIQKNVAAWLKKPELGIVPLFMAGDKQFFIHANRVAKEYGIERVFIGVNPFEKTDFKTGFAGVAPNFKGKRIHSLSQNGKITLMAYYAKQFLRNPAYINVSCIDTLGAFFSFYQAPQHQIDLYKYIPWNETVINETLINRYGWETDPGCTTTWRIGDGTAAFYNYIYYTVAGFTENDTLRSNQIRAGALTREEGLTLMYRDNIPRESSIIWYLERIGIDAEYALSTINRIPKLYRKEIVK